ncbi:MAG: transporter associated domain-containing protein, partial [Ruthenibacterium sp.]
PICDESIDNVVGILNIKDYFRLTDKAREAVLREAVKPAHFIPESVRADVLFAQMKNSHNHFAVVLDEYGGMLGIVTMNDLLEQLVGDLDDMEAADAPADLEQIDAQTWRIRGSAALDEVAQTLHISLPIDDYDTFGGWVLSHYGFIPQDGTSFELDTGSFHIKVTQMKEHRVEEAILCIGHDDNTLDDENLLAQSCT